MASAWQRRSVRVPIAIAASLVALIGSLATIGTWRSPAAGPMPEGTRLADGVVLSYDAADGATAIVAEIRGMRLQPGGVRETLYVAHEPFEKDDFEALGRGATIGEISPDGRFVSWLASKERGDRTGSGRLRSAEPGAKPISERTLLPPVLFDRDAPRAVAIGSYQAAAGRGTLLHFDLAAGTSKMLSPNVPVGAFALLSGGRTFALRRPWNAAHAEAVVLGPSISPAIPLTASVDEDGTVFRVAFDRRAVTIRLAPDAAGRRALVRWSDGVAGLAPVAEDAAAWTLDRTGHAWWIDSAQHAFREPEDGGTPVSLGDVAGRDPVSVHPLPSGSGAWIAFADRPCVAATDGATTRGGCVRLALAGTGPVPPQVPGLRRIVAPPEGWPVVLFGPVEGRPAFVAIGDPVAPRTIEDGGLLGTAFSPDGRRVAARIDRDGGEAIVLVDLESGTTTVLAEQAPESLLSWHGDAVVYAWRNRWWRGDPRNGLYRVIPDDPANGQTP